MTQNTPNHNYRELILIKLSTFALVLWAGATWAAGYIFAPVFFASFPKEVAGEAAGLAFNAVNILSLICAAVMLFDLRIRFSKQLQHQRDLWWIVGVVFLVLVQYIGLAPKMAALKMLFPSQQALTDFGRLHGVSQVIYLLQSAGLAVLVWRRLTK